MKETFAQSSYTRAAKSSVTPHIDRSLLIFVFNFGSIEMRL